MNHPRPVRCPICHAADSRDEAHAQGCPARRDPLSKPELLRLALAIEDAWARKAAARPPATQEYKRVGGRIELVGAPMIMSTERDAAGAHGKFSGRFMGLFKGTTQGEGRA